MQSHKEIDEFIRIKIKIMVIYKCCLYRKTNNKNLKSSCYVHNFSKGRVVKKLYCSTGYRRGAYYLAYDFKRSISAFNSFISSFKDSTSLFESDETLFSSGTAFGCTPTINVPFSNSTFVMTQEKVA